MATTIEMIEQMQANAEKARQAAKDGSKAFVSNSIVLLADGQKALVRPVYNMDNSIVRQMHDKYKNKNVALSSREDKVQGVIAAPISSLCAVHQGLPCLFCAQPKEEKVEARAECFVPVYLFGIKEQQVQPDGTKAWVTVTYTDPDGNIKPVKGFRMLRLKQGSAVLDQLMAVYRDKDYGEDVTGCDFVLERHGSGLDTKYSLTPKPPKPMEPNLKAAIPPKSKFEEILLEIYEPRTLQQPAIVLTPIQQAPTITRTEVQRIVSTSPEEEFTF